MAKPTKAEQRVIDYIERQQAETDAYLEAMDGQSASDEQREMAYWASQPYTVTFEVTIDPEGAEVSCGANSGSWTVTRLAGEPEWFRIDPWYARPEAQPVGRANSLNEAVGKTVQLMLAAQDDGDGAL